MYKHTLSQHRGVKISKLRETTQKSDKQQTTTNRHIEERIPQPQTGKIKIFQLGE